MCLRVLTLVKTLKTIGILFYYLSGNGDVAEAFFVPQVFEGGNHVGLEVVPSEAELLVVSHGGSGIYHGI